MHKLSTRRRVALATSIIAAFMLLFFILVFTYSFPDHTPSFLSIFINFHFEFMILMVGAGVVAGAMIFYLMSEEVATVQKESKGNAELALSLLNPDERKSIQLLLEKNGECMQSDISRLEGMTRLKAHRVCKSLAIREIISLERRGKIVVIKLADNFKQGLSLT